MERNQELTEEIRRLVKKYFEAEQQETKELILEIIAEKDKELNKLQKL